MDIQLKRAYDAPTVGDGKRILVDRLWPRGLRKEAAQIDEWLKNIAPSPELRKEFCHIPEKFPWFKAEYTKELLVDAEKRSLCDRVRAWAEEGPVTLVYAAKDGVHNHAVVLIEVLTS